MALLPPSIMVLVKGGTTVAAIELLHEIYDFTAEEICVMQIRKWSEECMRKIGNCPLTKIPYVHLYTLLLKASEIDGTKRHLDHI